MRYSVDLSPTDKPANGSSLDDDDHREAIEQEQHDETTIAHQDHVTAKGQATGFGQMTAAYLPEDMFLTSGEETVSSQASVHGVIDESSGQTGRPSKELFSRVIGFHSPQVNDTSGSKVTKTITSERRKSTRDTPIAGLKVRPAVTRAMSGVAGKEDDNKKKAEPGPRSRAAVVAQKTNAGDADNAGDSESRRKLSDNLTEAVKTGDSESLRTLIGMNLDCLEIKFGDSQESLIHLVIRNGRAFIPLLLDTLLSFDLDINARDAHDRTPLMLASRRGLFDTTKRLIEHGAGIDDQDRQKESALHDAVSKRREDVVKLLINHDANPNMASHLGRTPLHAAAWRGWHEMVELLLLVDTVDVNPKDIRSGYTPLHDACSRGHARVVRTLLESGADVNARSSKNWTPLHIAAKNGNALIVRDLLQFGADTMLYTQTLDTPETLVSKNDENGIAELLKRKDLAGIGTTHRTGKDLNVSKPTPDQESICKYFEGFIWPSVDKTYRYDNFTVWDMLYSENPKLKKLKGRSAPVWIHLPANIIDWVEDIFKLIYSTENDSEQEKSKAASTSSLTHDTSEPALRNVLNFLETHLGEVGRQEYTCFRQPHYKCAIGPRPRLRTFDNHMISAVIPIVDVDMQQPYYYIKDHDVRTTDDEYDDNTTGILKDDEVDDSEESSIEVLSSKKRRLVKRFTTSEGRALDEAEKGHIQYMWDLRNAYIGQVHLSRTLDESFYELLNDDNLNRRNGDQVLSRYLARFRFDVEGDEEDRDEMSDEDVSEDGKDSGVGGFRARDQDATQENEKEATHLNISTYDSARSNGRQAVGDEEQSQTPFKTGSSILRRETATKDSQADVIAPTPSELENQANETSHQSRKWFRNLVSKFKTPKELAETLKDGTESDIDDGLSESDADSDMENSDNNDGDDSKQRRPRQQILVVPQLWIWKVENIIVTTFPERWDSSNPRVLPKIMLASVEERNKTAKKEKMLEDMDVQGVLHSVIESSLGFEPWFSAYNEDRSYQDAFAAEISHVSSETTACYGRYRESLGKAEESFATAMKEETELLITTDDILSEIAMVKRAQEDQSIVCIEMKAEEDIIAQTKKKDLGGSPYHNQRTPTRPRTTQRSLTEDSQLELMSFQDSHRDRPVPSPRPNTKLERQEDDARRVRESIITLLDLRQRQASTESAINSGKQSQILFEQSKVLFIFTGATVIFAPLSWVASLLALKVESFTPDAWRIEQAFGASFGSLMGTLLLCLVFWIVYDYYFSKTDGSKAKRYDRRWFKRLSWRTRLRGNSSSTSNAGSSRSGSTIALTTEPGSRASLEKPG